MDQTSPPRVTSAGMLSFFDTFVIWMKHAVNDEKKVSLLLISHLGRSAIGQGCCLCRHPRIPEIFLGYFFNRSSYVNQDSLGCEEDRSFIVLV